LKATEKTHFLNSWHLVTLWRWETICTHTPETGTQAITVSLQAAPRGNM